MFVFFISTFFFNSFPLESPYLASNYSNKAQGFNAFGHTLDRGTASNISVTLIFMGDHCPVDWGG